MKTTTSPLSATDLAALERESWIDPATAAHVVQAKHSIYRLAHAGLILSYAAGPRLRGRRFNLAELKDLAQKAVKP